MTDYVELHCRSAFSFLRGASTPEQLAERAAQLQLSAVALCDRDGVYGAPRFFGRARELGIRPIVGAELTMTDGAILPVLVQSRHGYENLCQLLTRAHLRNQKGQCSVLWDDLPEFAEGLVACANATVFGSARVSRPVFSVPPKTPAGLSSADEDQLGERRFARDTRTDTGDARAPRSIEQLLGAFGRENVFIEIHRHRIRGEEKAVRSMIQLAGHFHVPLLATNGVLYSTENERPVLDVFTCIRHHTHLDAAGKLLEQNGEQYLKSAAEMRDLFRDLPEAIENTVHLAERLDFTLENLGYEFPKFITPNGEPMELYLREMTFAGARKRYPNGIPDKVKSQLEHELHLINRLGFAGYFLIVWDIVKFCRENKIMAQGRGSAANSAVCYCLHITAVDAVERKLLFERFLSEGRKTWPDIDIDLPSGERRERVIQEVYRRYGERGAAMTANVITYRGRSAAREIGKALNLSPDILNRFSNLYANGDFPHTLDLQAQMEKSGLPKTHPRAAAFAALCKSITGLPRHLGQHSGGMIICQGKLDKVVPLENASMPGRVVAQWDKEDCENLGIIKVDFLGLGMMSVIQDSMELLSKRGGPADIAQFPADDSITFEMIRAADTVGVFQIESRAQMATLPRMNPKHFYDLVIEVAIIRPGPIQGNLMHPYLARRAERQPVSYYHESLEPLLKPILERTLGVPLFQEQMLAMAMRLADFTGAEAEELRRALSYHRSNELMSRVIKKLRAALAAKNFSNDVVENIIAAIQSFALYGFPESHAISFAILAYATAYLKAHYAPEFYASLLNNQPMGFYSSATLIKDGQRHGVKFLPVDVMKSGWDCFIEGTQSHSTNPAADFSGRRQMVLPFPADKVGGEQDEPQFPASDSPVRLGLRVVKTLSENGAKRLVVERERASFASLEDLKRRARLNKDELRTLAEIGALNCFATHRRGALWEVEKKVREGDLFEGSARVSSRALPHVVSTHGGALCRVDEGVNRRTRTACGVQASSPLAPMNYAERIQADFKGMHLSTGRHPMALLRPNLTNVCRAGDLSKVRHGSHVRIAGNVICRQRPGTAKGFVFISLEDETGISNAVVTPPMFEANRLVITEESFLLIEGRLQHIDNVIHVKAEKIERLPHDELVGAQSYDFH